MIYRHARARSTSVRTVYRPPAALAAVQVDCCETPESLKISHLYPWIITFLLAQAPCFFTVLHTGLPYALSVADLDLDLDGEQTSSHCLRIRLPSGRHRSADRNRLDNLVRPLLFACLDLRRLRAEIIIGSWVSLFRLKRPIHKDTNNTTNTNNILILIITRVRLRDSGLDQAFRP
ncbi:hypothetical protein BDW67DRAFT_124480 [Aspergillus spinulosporus]